MKSVIFIFTLLLLFSAFLVDASGQKPTETTSKAAKMISGGNIKGALEVLDKAIEKKNDLFEAYRMRSFLRKLTGDFAGALDDLSSAIEIKPDDAELYQTRAETRLMLRQDSALILKDLDLAIANGRKIEKVFVLRANIRRPAGDAEGAIADYQTAIGLRPDYAQAHVGLASILPTSNEELQNMSDKTEQAKNTVLAYSNLASIYERRKEFEKALATVDKAFKIDRSDFYAYQIRGRIKAGLGNYQDALDDLNSSIKMMQAVSSVYLDRGIVYFMLGKDEEAQKDFEKYLQAFPGGRENYEKRLDEAKKKRAETGK